MWCIGPVDGIQSIRVGQDDAGGADYKNRFRAVHRLGAASQPVIRELSGRYDSVSDTDTGNDLCHSLLTFYYDTLATDASYDGPYAGRPNVTAEIRGMRCWDPRRPEQSVTNQDTWRWTNNPALCLLHWMTSPWGMDLPLTNFNLDSFIQAADECDVLVDIPARPTLSFSEISREVTDRATRESLRVDPNAPFSEYYDPNFRPWQGSETTQKRYECDFVLELGGDRRKIVEEILRTMQARLVWSNGVFSVRLFRDAAPVMWFHSGNMERSIRLEEAPLEDRLNLVTVRFPNRDKAWDYDTVTWPRRSTDLHRQWVAEDGGRRHREVTLDACVDAYRAADVAESMVRVSRRSRTSVFQPTTATAILLEPDDIIVVHDPSIGWEDQLCMVVSVDIDADLQVVVTAREFDLSDWAYSSKDPVEPPPLPDSTFRTTTVQVENFAATTSTVDGSPRIEATWNAVPRALGYNLQYREAAATDWTDVEGLGTTATAAIIDEGLEFDTGYELRISFDTDIGGRSTWQTLTGITTPKEDGGANGNN